MSTVVDDDGITRYTGQMTDVPPTGESRAQALLDYAAANDFDVAQAIAYADATSDLSMLETVGFPVAVNPEARLAALARKRGWLVEHWDRSSGAAAPILPLATRKGTHGERLLTRVATSFAEPLVASSNRKGRPSTKRKARR
jgi:hypothetical protein